MERCTDEVGNFYFFGTKFSEDDVCQKYFISADFCPSNLPKMGRFVEHTIGLCRLHGTTKATYKAKHR